MFFLGRAMSALTDEQLHAEHEAATNLVARYLVGGHLSILDAPVRRAKAAQREILSRGKHQARLHAKNYD